MFLSAGHDEVAATLINLSTFSIFTCLKASQLLDATEYRVIYRLETAWFFCLFVFLGGEVGRGPSPEAKDFRRVSL